MGKQRYNLYLTEAIYSRTKGACEKLGMPISEYIDDFLAGNIDMLEAAAKAKDTESVKIAKSDLADVLMEKMIALADELKAVKALND